MGDAYWPLRLLRMDRAKEFHKCVTRYHNCSKPRKLLTYQESLRDIETCLGSVTGKLFHLGFRGDVARSTLADTNETRDFRIFAGFAQVLIGIARPLYADDPLGVDLDHHRSVPKALSVG